MVSSWTSTSSSEFPGGSLGPWNKLAGLCLCVGLLGHILDLVVRQHYFASACCTDGSVTPFVCNICIFLIYELLYESLCRRVCDVPVVPQVSISLLCLIAMPVFMA